MLDLKNMSDEEFSILVTPPTPQAIMYVKIEENGNVLLSSKVAEKLAKTPVQIRFNRDCTAIQIAVAGSTNSVTFPKSGRKTMPNAVKILKENKIPLPAIFNGELCEETTKWRGERQTNPTGRLSPTTRNTKKK
ncbi:hypothetical protein ACTQ3Z_07230 [Lawsonibacter sp. LCP25S3_F5]